MTQIARHFSLAIPIMQLAPKWMPPDQGNFALQSARHIKDALTSDYRGPTRSLSQSYEVIEEFWAPYHRRLRGGTCKINQYGAS